jgi:hypothetical protein
VIFLLSKDIKNVKKHSSLDTLQVVKKNNINLDKLIDEFYSESVERGRHPILK